MTGFYVTGSINVPTIQDAFQLVGERLQPGVTRVPDGEPGDRANWVLTQADHFLNNPTLEVVDNRAKVRPGAGRSISGRSTTTASPPSRMPSSRKHAKTVC